MKIAITGANGMLGQALLEKCLDAEHVEKVFAFDIIDFDITDTDKTNAAISEAGADVLINCAAYTNVNGAENDEKLAMHVNCDGAGSLARACQNAGTRMIHISTDYVFDGEKKEPYIESDPPSPASAYGRSKLEGERAVMKYCPDALIVRTSWLYGPGGKNFVTTIIKLARKQDKVNIVNDQFGAPTFTCDLASTLVELTQTDTKGFLHIANSGYTTWYDFAREITKLTQIKGLSILPCTTSEFHTPAPRPKNSRLDTTLLEKRLGHRLRAWDEALKDYLL